MHGSLLNLNRSCMARPQETTLKILYLNCIETNSGWGAEWFMDAAFRLEGCEPHSIDYRRNRNNLYLRFLKAPQCNAFFLQRGDWFPLELVRAVQTPRFFWTSELFSRCRDHDHLLKSGLFDHVFMRTPNCIDAVVEKGWIKRERCSVLLSAFDQNLHRSLPLVQKDIDVLFIGSLTPRRIAFLESLPAELNLLMVSAFGESMVEYVNRAKIVLNIHAEDYLDTETRVFETLGCGAFLLTERLSVENPFTDQDLVQFGGLDDLVGNIEYYLIHDHEREAIAAHGARTALDAHTYMHRAQEIIDVMSRFVQTSDDAARPTIKKSLELHRYGLAEIVTRINREIIDQSRAGIQIVRELLRGPAA